jgi:hypothetical protein
LPALRSTRTSPAARRVGLGVDVEHVPRAHADPGLDPARQWHRLELAEALAILRVQDDQSKQVPLLA